ncbi:hypothetical protein BYT27DRAFT_7224114 [Phlegmacium glaucopus]|nr:hypothetical protein BYT27DRAFT_7224114 [Phlegmacium glaucopus]
MSVYANPGSKPKLDPGLYNLQPHEVAFFKQQTGIQDDEVLKQHIIQVQAKAYEIYGYPCIRLFSFARLKTSILPGYNQALRLLKERNHPILLDVGCCLGTDVRKAVFDGWPVQDIIAFDIQKGFWEYGHQLFKSTPEAFPATFILGDVFDPNFISRRGPFVSMAEINHLNGTITPPLNTLTSLNPLQGKISAIHMSSFFHLFSEDCQLQLAKLISSLLSPKKGSVIFGQHGARPVKGFRVEQRFNKVKMFCHSPESWTQMWLDVFGGEDRDGNNRVKVVTELINVVRKGFSDHPEDEKFWLLKWSVTRL